MGKFFSVALLLLAPAAGALEPAFVARTPVVQPSAAARWIEVSMAADGSFAALWWDEDSVAEVRRFSPDGIPLTAAQPLGMSPRLLAGRPDGSFVVLGAVGDQLKLRSFDAAANGGPLVDLILPPRSTGWIGLEPLPSGKLAVCVETAGPPARIELHLFSADGQAIGAGRVVAAGVAGFSFGKLELAPQPDGGVAVFWEHRPQNGITGAGTLYQRRYGADGEPLGAAQALPVAEATETRSTFTADGRAILVYRDMISSGVGAVAIDAEGNAGAPFTLWGDGVSRPVTPDVAVLQGGDLAVATDGWIGEDWGPSINLVRSRNGVQVGASQQVIPSVYPFDYWGPRISSSGDRLVVAWQRYRYQVWNSERTFFQVFDATLFADSFETGGTGNWTLVE